MGDGCKVQSQSTWGKVIVLILIGLAIVYNSRGRTLEPEAEDAIRAHLHQGGSLRHALNEFEDAGGVEAEKADELLEDLTDAARAEVEIVSIKAKGRGKKPVVRVEFLIDGEPPEAEDPLQSFRLYRSGFRGWQVERKTTALAYYPTFLIDSAMCV